jgi:sugar/nucleoside kinase (ribokinase family)
VTVATLGDLVLDVSTRPLGPIAGDTDTPSANRLEAGGQAANVAAWVAAAGAPARLVTRRSADPAGRMAEERVRARGVEVVGPLGPEPAGIIVSLIGADGTRSMLTDRGAGPLLAAADLQAGWFEGVRWLHVSGYALTAEPVLGAALAAAARVRAQGGRVSVDLASVAAIEEAGPRVFLHRVAECRPALVFGTQAELAYDPLPAPLVVAKRGAAGAALRGTTEADRPARPADLIDPTGAGDALAGGMLAALAAGAQAAAALDAGLEAAARCVGRRGAMPGLR